MPSRHTSRHILHRVEGDTQPDIVVQSGLDLTGFTVKMHTKTTGSSSTQSKTAIIDGDPAVGNFHIEFSASDLLLKRGNHEIEFEFTGPAGNFTIPIENTIIVETRADIR